MKCKPAFQYNLFVYLVCAAYLWFPWGSCRCRRSPCPDRCLRSCTAGSDTRWCWSRTASRWTRPCSGSWRRPGRRRRSRSGTGWSNTHWCLSRSASQCNLKHTAEFHWSPSLKCFAPFSLDKMLNSVICVYVNAFLPSVHSQVYLLGPSAHLAPFLHGVLAHSSMSIWQRFPVKPEKQEAVIVCVKKCVCVQTWLLCSHRSEPVTLIILDPSSKASQRFTKSAY